VLTNPISQTNARLPSTNTLIHPSLPPLNRPIPPSSTLVFYNDTSEEDTALSMELGFSRPSEDVNGDILEPANKRQRTDLEHVASTEATVVSGAADIPVTHGVASGVSIASQVPPSSVVEVTSSKEDPTKSGDVTTIAATSARDVDMDAPQEENVTLVNKTFIWTPPSAANEVAVSVSTTMTSATSPPVKQTDAVPGDLGKVVCYASDGEEIPAIDMGSSDDEEWNEEDD
jgi:hypothetical protein